MRFVVVSRHEHVFTCVRGGASQASIRILHRVSETPAADVECQITGESNPGCFVISAIERETETKEEREREREREKAFHLRRISNR